MNVFIATIDGLSATLTPEESWHCSKVLRRRAGDTVMLIDGKGGMYKGTLDQISEKLCRATITEGPLPVASRAYRLHLAIAPTKHIDRIEWMVEKAVEMGIDEISFIQCKNSERVNLKTERIKKIVESAVKQSLQANIPQVNELLSLDKFILSAAADQKLIAHCEDGNKADIRSLSFKGKSTLIMIGPEGDFTKDEILLAEKSEFKAISLGANRLRTETAGLFAVNTLAVLT